MDSGQLNSGFLNSGSLSSSFRSGEKLESIGLGQGHETEPGVTSVASFFVAGFARIQTPMSGTGALASSATPSKTLPVVSLDTVFCQFFIDLTLVH